MRFPWDKYKELPLNRRNTLQVFITNDCNLRCNGCFARNISSDAYISLEEYSRVIDGFLEKRGQQINLLGGGTIITS